jgi:hypothetical protein
LLFLKAKKCHFKQKEMEFLGYLIMEGTLKIDPTKQHSLEEWPRVLKNIKDICSTLGVLGYQQQFIPNFSHLAHPLNELLKKNKKFEWTEECTQAVDALIKVVTSNPILLCPDFKKLFILEVDSSQYATGAILYNRTQMNIGGPWGIIQKRSMKQKGDMTSMIKNY